MILDCNVLGLYVHHMILRYIYSTFIITIKYHQFIDRFLHTFAQMFDPYNVFTIYSSNRVKAQRCVTLCDISTYFGQNSSGRNNFGRTLTKVSHADMACVVSSITVSAKTILAKIVQNYKAAAKPPVAVIFIVAIPRLLESSLRVSAITGMWVPPPLNFSIF